MSTPEQDEIRRALAANAVKARHDAERYAEKLDKQPFWRWRGRKQLAKARARAEQRERAALEVLRKDRGPR